MDHGRGPGIDNRVIRCLIGNSIKIKGYSERPQRRTNMENKRKPDPVKMQALRSLPIEIKQQLTREEADAFLYEDVWPDSLREKLKNYLVDE